MRTYLGVTICASVSEKIRIENNITLEYNPALNIGAPGFCLTIKSNFTLSRLVNKCQLFDAFDLKYKVS